MTDIDNMQEVIRVLYANGVYVILLDGVEQCSCCDEKMALSAIKWCWDKWLGSARK